MPAAFAEAALPPAIAAHRNDGPHLMARSNEFERALDRYLGIPALFVMGLFRIRRSIPLSPRRIGIIQPTAVGDMFLISGLVLHLRECFPEAEIHIFHGPSNAISVGLLPVDVVSHRCEFRRLFQTIRKFRQARLDVAIDCAPWARLTALLTALSGAKATLGFRSAGQHIHPAFDIAVPYLDNRHEIENHRAMAEVFGPIAEYKLSVRRGRRPRNLELPYTRVVVCHVAAGGSRAAEKSWPLSYWAMLARGLVERGMIVAFSGAPDDAAQISTVLDLADLPEDRCFSLAGRTSLAELAFVVSQARLLVTIDTGIAHLGAAVGATVIGLHGPTRFRRWGACNSRSCGLDSPHPAAGFIHFGFERHPQGNEIMAQLTVEDVCSAVYARLAETDTRFDLVS